MPTPAELAEHKRLAEARDKIVKALVSEIMVGTCAHDFHRRRMASQQSAPVVPPPQLNSILNAICGAVYSMPSVVRIQDYHRNAPALASSCVQTLLLILGNVVTDPGDDKKRSVSHRWHGPSHHWKLRHVADASVATWCMFHQSCRKCRHKQLLTACKSLQVKATSNVFSKRVAAVHGAEDFLRAAGWRKRVGYQLRMHIRCCARKHRVI